jgi:hypothetical protein
MTMVLWPIILGSAVGGGLLLLHGIGKSKAGSEQMLGAYQEMLEEVARRKASRKDDKADGGTGEPDSEAATEHFEND